MAAVIATIGREITRLSKVETTSRSSTATPAPTAMVTRRACIIAVICSSSAPSSSIAVATRVETSCCAAANFCSASVMNIVALNASSSTNEAACRAAPA